MQFKNAIFRSKALLPWVTVADQCFCWVAPISVAFEKLNLPFVPLRGSQRIKSAQITALAGCRICFPRVEAVAAGFEFTDHKFLQRDILIRAALCAETESRA